MKEVYRQHLDRPLTAPVLAFGGDIKCALALGAGRDVVVYEPVGDLADPDNQDRLEIEARTLLADVHGGLVLACDTHPGYVSHALCHRLGAEGGRAVVQVQHHRAHVAAVAAEHALLDAPIVGLAFDGTGYGDDGAIWGGEFFVGSVADELRRQASFAPLTLYGGDVAVRQPWRIALAFLLESRIEPDVVRRWRLRTGVSPEVLDTFARGLSAGVNCVRTTALGRWFDCFSALWGIRTEVDFEAQAAIELQKTAEQHDGGCFLGPATVRWMGDELACIQFDEFLETVEYMLSDWGPSHAALWARQFHCSVADAVTEVAVVFAEKTGAKTVCCGGGCFLNSLLCGMLDQRLGRHGLRRLQSASLPPGDQAIALGQVVLADVALRR